MGMRVILIVILVSLAPYIQCICKNNTSQKSDSLETYVKPTIVVEVPDEYLAVPNLIRKYGYPAEIHSTKTRDGYLLNLHRIPYGKQCADIPDKPVVFLQHGLFGSSADWIVSGPQHSLAYLLADSGYDVWLGNSRGNSYSDAHSNLNNSDINYWNFSWEEMGELDLAASVDYILDVTGKQCIYFVGHSIGSALFFILMSSQPRYNNKISASFHLAPAFYFTTNFNFQTVRNMDPVGEFLVREPMQDDFERWECYRQSGVPGVVCNSLRFLIGGYNSQNIDKNQLPSIISHHFAGTSAKAFIHYSQAVISGQLYQYDYGTVANLEIYGCSLPPGYNITLVTSPIYIYYSAMDPVVGKCEIQQLTSRLSNVASIYETPAYTHYDFLWGTNSKNDVYSNVIEQMRNNPGYCRAGQPVCGRGN